MICNGTKVIEEIQLLLKSNLLPEEVERALLVAVDIVKKHDMDSCDDGQSTILLANGGELSPHVFEEIETIENARVTVQRCIHCGKEEIWWERK